MRRAAILLAFALAACAGAPETAGRAPSEQRSYDALVSGKTAGAPVRCLSDYNMINMQIIDGRTVAYPLGSRTTYIVSLSPGCGRLGQGQAALVTRQLGTDLCRGDFAEVLDPASRMTVGSCHVVEIQPYSQSGTAPAG